MRKQEKTAYINILLVVITLVSLILSLRLEKDFLTGIAELVLFIMALHWTGQLFMFFINKMRD